MAALGTAMLFGVTACSLAPGRGTPPHGPAPSMANMAPPSGSTRATTLRPALKGDVDVRIVDFSFSPATVTVRAGQTVEWTNQDSVAHTVDLSGVISDVLNRGDSYTQRFAAPGTYPYICSIHPFMHGTVVVTP